MFSVSVKHSTSLYYTGRIQSQRMKVTKWERVGAKIADMP